ncbi:Stress-associated endoplasmic reticulum protein 2 [Glycine soja]|nr:Stress-associated endoplasmic reticulum protein 2 [Glycine max]
MALANREEAVTLLSGIGLLNKREKQRETAFHSDRAFTNKVEETTSRRLADRKVEKFEKNITKRGFVPDTTTKKGKDYPVGPVLLGFFVFVVIGSWLNNPWKELVSLELSSLPDNQDSNEWRHGLNGALFWILCHLLFLSLLVENANTSLHVLYLY